ncbi:MAG: hypothetical protein SFX72_02335 [Isosphaeraceae bacterium]|nr:hypothetical protein [Isosphaeraceae bacterium]
MSPLTRPQRQAIATLALLLCTVAPTIFVIFTAIKINRPGHVRDVEIELRRSLGLQVTLQAVRYPAPGRVVYEGVVLRQEEPKKSGLTEVARADRVMVRADGSTLGFETVGLALHGSSAKAAISQLETLLERSGQGRFHQVSLTAPSCAITLGDDENARFEIKELAARFRDDRTAPSLSASYRVASAEGSSRCELELSRDRGVEPAATSVVMRTMEGAPLPARMLDLFFDSNEWLGASAKLLGELALRRQGAGEWKADFRGELIGVDLANLFIHRFPLQRVAGLAHLRVERALWEDRPGQGFGWAEIDGSLTTGPGSASLDFLRSITQEMNFRVTRRIEPGKNDVSFNTLALRFRLGRDGQIEIGGALSEEFAPDDVLVINDRPVMKSPQGVANVRGLIKVLHPGGAETLVPISAESQMLSRFLPLPKGAPRDDLTVPTLKAN